jgi:hypothetical protein
LVVSMVPLISAAINVITGLVFSASAIACIVFLVVPLLPVNDWFGSEFVQKIRNYTA